MTDLSNQSIYESILSKSKKIHGKAFDFYSPTIIDEDHLKIKCYQAVDRLNMYIAHDILGITLYEYDLMSIFKEDDRKSLRKINDGLDGINFEFIRDIWHEKNKEIFYIQKEELKRAKKIDRNCILARVKSGDDIGFLSLKKDVYSISKNLAEALEFPAFDLESDIKIAADIVNKMENIDLIKVFYNEKMNGRTRF